jgi:type VI secretion system Hcp family effector
MGLSKFRKQAFIFFILSVLVLAFSVVPAAAAESDDYDIYLKLDGINGDSTTRGYEKWIQLNDFSFEVENKATVGSGSGSGAGKAAAQPISINKNFDTASIPLFLSTTTGKSIEKGQIVFVKHSGNEKQASLTIDLERVLISNFSLYDTHENIELTYGAITFKYNAVGPDGKTSTFTGGWDFTKNQKK